MKKIFADFIIIVLATSSITCFIFGLKYNLWGLFIASGLSLIGVMACGMIFAAWLMED